MRKTLINTDVVPYLRGIDTAHLISQIDEFIFPNVVPYLRGIDTI